MNCVTRITASLDPQTLRNSSTSDHFENSKSKVKQLYLTSITRNSNSTDKPDAGGALILLPPLHQCSILRVLKLLELH